MKEAKAAFASKGKKKKNNNKQNAEASGGA